MIGQSNGVLFGVFSNITGLIKKLAYFKAVARFNKDVCLFKSLFTFMTLLIFSANMAA